MGDPILRVEDLRKQFGELVVLRGVSLTVNEQGTPQQIFTKAAHERTP